MVRNLWQRAKLTYPAHIRKKIKGSGWWTFFTISIALLVVIPVFTVIANIFIPTGDIWQHLASTVLKDYVMNTFWLLIGVGLGVFILGEGSAWLVTMCRFPGSRYFEWMLILPMAVPAYLMAYSFTDFLSFTGTFIQFLSDLTDSGVWA